MEIGYPRTIIDMMNEEIHIIRSDGMVEIIKFLEKPVLFSIGAEAVIYKAKFLGIDAIIKWRFPKIFMPRNLDIAFRRDRTEKEAKVMFKLLQANINIPIPLYIESNDGIIIMEYIDGNTFRELIDHMKEEELCSASRTVGIYVGSMHSIHIVHGDLTTSNVMIENGTGDIYLIDFGLSDFSKRVEDYAVDIHIYFRSIESAHYRYEDILKKCFIDGYSEVVGSEKAMKILKLVDNIRKRGRYVAERKLRSEWRYV